MKNKIVIASRTEVKRKIIKGLFPDNTAVISFFDAIKDYDAPLDYSNVCDRVFYVAIHDIDFDSLTEYDLAFGTYFPEAKEMALFIIKNISEGYDIICQCEYGEGRSAGCAAAIKEFYDQSGIEIFSDYRYCPNKLIFHKLLNALNEVNFTPFYS